MCLRSFEELIRPDAKLDRWARDLFGAVLVIAMTGTLLIGWKVGTQRYFMDVVGQMFSFYLLAALGFALALRVGAVDLSVWMVATTGGAAAVGLMHMGFGPGATLLGAAALGAMIGLVNGLLTTLARIPSVIITAIIGLLCFFALRQTAAELDIESFAVAQGAFSGWLAKVAPAARILNVSSIVLLRTMLVALILGAVLMVISSFSGSRYYERFHRSPRLAVTVALCASGGLSGLAGAIWLVDHQSSPVPTWPIGDLLIPAAALLAGAAFLSGRGRTVLVTLCMPATVLAATIWWLEVLHPQPAWLQLLVLMGMTVTTHWTIAQAATARHTTNRSAVSGALLTGGGMVVMAGSVGAEAYALWRTAQIIGAGIWLTGMVIALRWRVLSPSSCSTLDDADMHR